MATGYEDPARLGLPTDPALKSQSYAAPLSFVGSTRRIVAWASKLAKRSPAFAVLGWVLGVIALLLAWTVILFWYFIIFGLFGIFVIPFRMMRRSSRKSQHIQRTALATQQGLYQQQAAVMELLARQHKADPSTVPPPPLPVPHGSAPPPQDTRPIQSASIALDKPIEGGWPSGHFGLFLHVETGEDPASEPPSRR